MKYSKKGWTSSNSYCYDVIVKSTWEDLEDSAGDIRGEKGASSFNWFEEGPKV